MFFNWKSDSINPIDEVFRPIARNDIEALLIEIRVRYEISLAIPWLVGILESKRNDVDRQQEHISKLEQELAPIRQKIAQVTNQLERHRSVSVAVAGGVGLSEFPDIRDGLKVHNLEIELNKLQFDAQEIQSLIANAFDALRTEEREYRTGMAHLETLQSHQSRPLPDSTWLVDWLRENIQ
jgi:prefoldin subunit 5